MTDLMFIEQNEDFSSAPPRVVTVEEALRILESYPWKDRAEKASQTKKKSREICPPNISFLNGNHFIDITLDRKGGFLVRGDLSEVTDDFDNIAAADIPALIKSLSDEPHEITDRLLRQCMPGAKNGWDAKSFLKSFFSYNPRDKRALLTSTIFWFVLIFVFPEELVSRFRPSFIKTSGEISTAEVTIQSKLFSKSEYLTFVVNDLEFRRFPSDLHYHIIKEAVSRAGAPT